jgi:hypothetical protein
MTGEIMAAGVDLDHAIAELNRAWREHALAIAVERDDARRRADKFAQLLTPAAAIAAAYLDRVHQPDLRDEATKFLTAVRRLGGSP